MNLLQPGVTPPTQAGPRWMRLLRLIRGEYREMPDLRLTLPQASRLWGLDPKTCSAALSALCSAGFLSETSDGAFVRRHWQSSV